MDKYYCDYCYTVLQEKTDSGNLEFLCYNCSFVRKAYDDETLLFTKKNDNVFLIDHTRPEDIVENSTSHRFKIDCKCGSKVGVMRIYGENQIVVKLCFFCKEQIN